MLTDKIVYLAKKSNSI